jgi:hypothetical protein
MLEDFIVEQPENKSVTQPPYFLIQWLVDAGSLDTYELDAEGNDVTNERKEGLDEDEIDDLVADTAYRTNEAGLAVIEKFSPKNRTMELLAIVPERFDTYIEMLDFLTERRSFAEVSKLLLGRDVLMSGRNADDRPLQPSVFIDKLADAGSIAWSDGWIITEEGKELLEVIREQRR